MRWLGYALDPVEPGMSMFLALLVVLVVAWLLGWVAFHVAGVLIHLLAIVAVISLLVHFVRGRSIPSLKGISTTERSRPA
jgi:uncharacterized protein DUF5670